MTEGLDQGNFHRRALRWDEAPLPPGYPRALLDPKVKAGLQARHKDKVQENLEERTWVLRKAEDDPIYQEKVLALCQTDVAWWIEHFAWTYDDRSGMDEPMVLYPFQMEKWVEPYKEMLTVKAPHRWTRVGAKTRGVGATWTALELRTWSLLFRDNHSTLIGSVFKEDVDDGGQTATHQSLFGKIRYLLHKLPRWMRERLLGPLFVRDEYNKRDLIQNPLKPRNHISGAQFSGMFGRGQRFFEVFGDEIAHAESMEAADTSLKQTTPRFEGISTPLGKGTFHYQLFSGALPGVKAYYVHWSEHPILDLDWYNEQRNHMTDEQVAQELDCSFDASVGGRVLKEVNLDTHFTLNEPDLSREVELQHEDKPLLGAYEPALPLIVVIDPGIADPMAILWAQWDAAQAMGRIVDFVQVENRTIDWLVPFVLGRIPEATHRGQPWPHDYGPVEERIIRRHRLWRPPETVLGDHYGTQRNQVTGLSAYDELRQYEIDVFPVRIDDDMGALTRTELLLRYFRFARRLIEQRNGPQELCPTLGEVVTQWRYPRRKPGDYRPITHPMHDVYCHGGDTLKMLAKMLDLPEASQNPVESGRVKKARGSDLVGGFSRWPRSRRIRRWVR